METTSEPGKHREQKIVHIIVLASGIWGSSKDTEYLVTEVSTPICTSTMTEAETNLWRLCGLAGKYMRAT